MHQTPDITLWIRFSWKPAWEELTEYKCVFCKSSLYDMKSYFFGAERSTMVDIFRYMTNKIMQQYRSKRK